MGSTQSCFVEDQADAVFNNQVILRQLLSMLPNKDIRHFRRLNKAVNQMASLFLRVRGNKVSKISDGVAMRSFLDRMANRLQAPLFSFTAFNLGVSGIPFSGILRFCMEMGPHVRHLEIDLEKVPLWWYLLMNCGQESEGWNGGKSKTIQLLQSFPNVQELYLTLADFERDNVLTGAEMLRLPPSFPNLRLISCTHSDVYIAEVPILRQSQQTFFVTSITRSPNLEHVVVVRSDWYLPGNFRILPGLLAAKPRPPTLSMNMAFPLLPVVNSSHWAFLGGMVHSGFSRLRSFDCRIYLTDNQGMNSITNFLNFQAQSLESLSLTCCYHMDNHPVQWVLPVFPNVTAFKIVFYRWPSIAIPAITPQHFPKVAELKRRTYPSVLKAIYFGDVSITGA